MLKPRTEHDTGHAVVPFVALGLAAAPHRHRSGRARHRPLPGFCELGRSGTADLIDVGPSPGSRSRSPTLSNVLLPKRALIAGGLIDSMRRWRMGSMPRTTATLHRRRMAKVGRSAWVTCTPSATPVVAKQSISTTKSSDFRAPDKRLPPDAIFAGHLYLARNTTTGPSSGAGARPAASAVRHWSLVAPNSAGTSSFADDDFDAGTVVAPRRELAAPVRWLDSPEGSRSPLRRFRPRRSPDFSSTGVPGWASDVTRIVDGRRAHNCAKRFTTLAARPAPGRSASTGWRLKSCRAEN